MKKLILSAAFLGLGVFGFAQQAQSEGRANFAQKQEERLQKMKTELNLTDAQVAQFKELYAKKAADRKQNADAQRMDRMQRMKQNEEDMQKILTPEQYKKFQEMKAKKMEEMRSNFEKRKAETTTVK